MYWPALSLLRLGFSSVSGTVTLISAEGETAVAIASKDEVAEAILDEVDHLRANAGRPAA